MPDNETDKGSRRKAFLKQEKQTKQSEKRTQKDPGFSDLPFSVRRFDHPKHIVIQIIHVR